MSSAAPTANFAYASPANDGGGLPLALSVFADRAHIRNQIRDDAEVAGFRIAEQGDVSLLLEGEGLLEGEALLQGEPRPLGEVVCSIARKSLARHWRRLSGLICAWPTAGRSWWSRPV